MAEVKRKITNKNTGKTTSKTASKVAGKPVTGKSTGKTVNKPAGKVTGKPAGKVVSKSAGKPASKPVSKPAPKTVSKQAGKTANRPGNKAASRSAEKGAIKNSPKAAVKRNGKAAKTPSKGAKPRLPAPKPAPKIDPQIFTANMELALLELKAEINENLIANNNDFKEIVEGTAKDLADIASDDIDRKIIEALGSQELKRLRLIESALGRIKQGKYGYCIKCGVEIPQERLGSIPYALMCIRCKSDEERRNR